MDRGYTMNKCIEKIACDELPECRAQAQPQTMNGAITRTCRGEVVVYS